MNGKGDKFRPVVKNVFDKNYDNIEWDISKNYIIMTNYETIYYTNGVRCIINKTNTTSPIHKVWIKDSKIHREDGPAIEYYDGSKKWYKNGKVHREDGPAVEWSDGTRQYY